MRGGIGRRQHRGVQAGECMQTGPSGQRKPARLRIGRAAEPQLAGDLRRRPRARRAAACGPPGAPLGVGEVLAQEGGREGRHLPLRSAPCSTALCLTYMSLAPWPARSGCAQPSAKGVGVRQTASRDRCAGPPAGCQPPLCMIWPARQQSTASGGCARAAALHSTGQPDLPGARAPPRPPGRPASPRLPGLCPAPCRPASCTCAGPAHARRSAAGQWLQPEPWGLHAAAAGVQALRCFSVRA